MKIICDTNALLFCVLNPGRLTRKAADALERGRREGTLACSDIVFWEIAMLVAKGRLQLPQPVEAFMDDLMLALDLDVLPITPAIASLSQTLALPHKDPADRLIAATAIVHRAALVTADEHLRQLPGLVTLWD
jgi:PIN domain nuclease of toxin-antitoxin system